MANRKQRRKTKEKLYYTNNENDNRTKIVIMLLIVLVVLSLFYLVTVLINNKNRALKMNEPKEEEVSIQYQEILGDNTFTMSPKEYYVLFYDFNGSSAAYYEYLFTTYSSKEGNYIYKVDLGSGFNKRFLSDKTNPKAQEAGQLKVEEATLIRIKNGKNIAYIEGPSQVIAEVLN